jgi:hypothetical protein
MGSDYTAALLIIDRSGSMERIKRDTEAGLKALVSEQAKLPGRITFDVITFDDQYDYSQKLKSPYDTNVTIDPRGGTALYDAIVRGCQEFKRTLDSLSEQPAHVQIIVATDGQENRSKHADALLVRDTIQFNKETFGWDFTFVGSDEKGIADAAKLGFEGKKTMKFASSASGVAGMSSGLSDYLRQTREGKDAGYDDSARKAAAH